ncbi:MAG: hypothetical protein ACLQVL_07665 [Terriglobia bacterium]
MSIDEIASAHQRIPPGVGARHRRLIHSKTIPATQVVRGAPWQIPVAPVESPEALQAARDIKNRHCPSAPQSRDECTLELTGFGLIEEEGESRERLTT